MSPLLKKTSFDSSKCVTLLELTLKRIKILRSKRLIVAKQSRDDVAKLLQKGQEANAAARVEHAFREQNIAEAYELLEQYCQLIIKRISAVKSQQECPPEVKEAIASLIYAAPRCGDLQELQKLRDILTSKYGAEYVSAILELKPECSANQQIIQKLSSRPPNSDTRLNLLKEIAREYKIDWNYQKAVAASFKNEESSEQDKQKVSRSPSEVSKGAVSTINVDNEKPTALVSTHQNEQGSSAARSAVPSRSNNSTSQPRDVPRANQISNVAQQLTVTDIQKPTSDSLHHDGSHERHTSVAAQHTIPSTTHDASTKAREFVGASKKPIVGSPTTVDEDKPHVSMHQVSSKEKESSPARAAAVSSSIRKATSRQKEFMGSSETDLHTSANKQKPSSMYVHQDKLRGQPIIPNPSRTSNSHHEEKGFASPNHSGTPGFVDKVKPTSVVTREDGFMEKGNSVFPATVSGPKPFVNSIQEPDVRVYKSSERSWKSELDKSKGQETSMPDISQAMVTPKPTSHSILNHETIATAESLAAKQYRREHKSYIRADTREGEEDHRSMENSGVNVRPKHDTNRPDVDPYTRLRQEGKMDYKYVSHAYKQAPEPERMPRFLDEEEDSSSYGYSAREQHKETHYQRASNALSHESDSSSQISKEREWGSKNALSFQDRHQVEGSSFNYHRNPSMLCEPSKGNATRLSAHPEREHDLADLKAATDSAARAADAALDMVRSISMRSKPDRKVGDVKASQVEPIPKTIAPHVQRKMVLGSTQDLESEAEFYDTSTRKNQELYNHSNIKTDQKKQENNTEAYQIQEPELYDSEIPHFDEYSSYESSEDEPPSYYTKGWATTSRKDDDAQDNKMGAPNKGNQTSQSPFAEQGPVNTSVHSSAKQRLQQDSFGSVDYYDCAESVEFLSSDAYNPQFDECKQSDNTLRWISATATRGYVSGGNTEKSGGMATYHQVQQERSSASYGYVDKGARGLGVSAPEGATRDVSKQRWKPTATEEVNAQPYIEGHIRASQHDHPAMVTQQDTHVVTGKHFGVSQRSVRSSRKT